jgi:hypothetical protein
MRAFVIASDVALGVFLGIFLFAIIARTWPSFNTPPVGFLTVAAAIIIVLFRRPNGSLVSPRDRA